MGSRPYGKDMRNILKFIVSLGVPQFVTIIVNFILVKYVSDDTYKIYILITSSALMAASVVISITNRIILTTSEDIDSGSLSVLQLSILVVSSFVAFIVYDISGINIFFALITSFFIIFYEELRTKLQKELYSGKYLFVSLFRSLSFLVLILITLLFEQRLISLAFMVSYIIPILCFRYDKKDSKCGFKIDLKFLFSRIYLFSYSGVLPIISLLPIAMLSRYADKTMALKVWVTAFSIYSVGNVVNAGLKKYLLAKYCEKGNATIDFSSMRYLTIILFVFLVIVNILSYIYIPSTLGVNSIEFSYSLLFLSISCIFSNILSPYSELLQSKLEYKFLLFSAFLNIFVMIVLSLYMIRPFGVPGVAIAFLLAYFLQNILIYIKCRKMSI